MSAMRHVLAALGVAIAVQAHAVAPEATDLLNDAAVIGDVTTYGMGYGQQRHSPLKQIDRQSVRRLVPVWNLSLANNFPQEAQPLLIDGIMYVTTIDATVAIDATTGKQIWRTPITLPQDVFAITCCGAHSRGAAAYQGKLFRGTLDAHVVALDLKTGKELWRVKSADYQEGYSISGAPLIANGVLLTGIAGGEYGVRGFLDGWDPDSGKHLWRRYTTAAPDEPGGKTWSGDSYLRGGGATWLTGSYDAELDLVFWGVGNGGPWSPALRNPGGPRDNLYINSALAVRPKTGEIAWHYQFSPNDPFDYDGVNELVLADLTVAGKARKVLIQANRNGFFYVIERGTGKLLAANPFVDKVNWAKGVDLKTGRPIDSEMTARIRTVAQMDEAVEVWPSALGGKNWSPMSWSASDGLAFANTLNFSFPYRTQKEERRKGAFYLGIDFTGFSFPENGPRGFLKAIEPLSGKSRWQVPFDIPNLGGVLSTDGGLVFTGALTGEFMAFDSSNGNKLWQFQTGSGVIGIPVTWERGGRQYVSVTSGVGGVYPLFSGDARLNSVPPGGSVWTFALFEDR
jgi:alcohol dehydrogenase (cytochrome c)